MAAAPASFIHKRSSSLSHQCICHKGVQPGQARQLLQFTTWRHSKLCNSFSPAWQRCNVHANRHTFVVVCSPSRSLSYGLRPSFLLATRKIVLLTSIEPPASSSSSAASSSSRKHSADNPPSPTDVKENANLCALTLQCRDPSVYSPLLDPQINSGFPLHGLFLSITAAAGGWTGSHACLS